MPTIVGILTFISMTNTTFKKSKKECKDQESIQSSTTPDPGYQWKSDNITDESHKARVLKQETSSFDGILVFMTS